MIRHLFFNSSLTAAILIIAAVSARAQDSYPDANQIVSVGGAVTEIIYALGEQDRLVGRDTTSNYPPEVFDLPDIGYMRRLSAEGILSINPDLIIAEEGSGPIDTIELLAEADIPFVTIPDAFTRDGIVAKITAVAAALGIPEKGADLGARIDADLKAAETVADHAGDKKRVLFILTLSNDRFLVSGTNSAADGIIRMAGGINVITEFEGYKPLTDEALLAAAPDIILLMNRTGQSQISDDALAINPAISVTPAGKSRAFLRMDGMFMLGFGPRTAQAILDLNKMFYPTKG